MWFILTFASAFFDSIKDVFGKKSMVEHDEYVAAWAMRFYALFLLTPLMFWYWPRGLDKEFWHAVIILAILVTATSIWYMKALKYSPLSNVLPIASLAPMFALVSGRFINHELPSSLGIVGVCLAVVGAYVLNVSQRQKHWLAPLTHLFTDRGSRLMFGVAVLWGITSAYDKVAILHSSPLFYVGFINLVYTLTLLPFMLARPGRLCQVFSGARQLAPTGVGQALAIVFQMLAVPLTYVAYVTAVKRSSSIFGVAWGKWFFKEDKIKERLLGAMIILLGVVLMLVS